MEYTNALWQTAGLLFFIAFFTGAASTSPTWADDTTLIRTLRVIGFIITAVCGIGILVLSIMAIWSGVSA